jgi:hypothetical protein
MSTPTRTFVQTPTVEDRNLERVSKPQSIWNATWSHTTEAWLNQNPSINTHKPLARTLDAGILLPLSSMQSTKSSTWMEDLHVEHVD